MTEKYTNVTVKVSEKNRRLFKIICMEKGISFSDGVAIAIQQQISENTEFLVDVRNSLEAMDLG